MPYVYRHFVPQNTAPTGAKRIGVYDSNGKKVCTIPLGGLTPPTTEPLYSFGLVSDMHLWKAGLEWSPDIKFDAALSFFESKGCVFCAHCGDITQTGFFYEGDAQNINFVQFAEYKRHCDAHPNLPVYGICGNHESYVVPISNNLTELKTYTGTDLFYTIEQGSDLFIFVGQPSGSVVMSDDAFTWLSETLEANADKRCFVFVHSHIDDNVEGGVEDSGNPAFARENSIFGYWGAAKTANFINLMKQYPNVILFHGHTHIMFEAQTFDEDANYSTENGFKSVHVPSSGAPRKLVSADGTWEAQNSESQGYIVDVYEDCVVLKGYDLVNQKPVPIAQYRIDT